jgi:hypothetical protein
VLIEVKANGANAEKFQRLFTKRLRDFNNITNQELGERVFD